MSESANVGREEQRANQTARGLFQKVAGCLAGGLIATAMTLMPSAARAADGCVVLLCFAAPSWRAIPHCVPPIRQVLRDLARGKSFPVCRMAGAGNSSQHAWASAPDFCPPQYTRTIERRNGPVQVCDYSGAVSVSVNGSPFARTWWTPAGDTVTEFSAAAKVQLGSWDTRFDDDYAAWLAKQPPQDAAQAPNLDR